MRLAFVLALAVLMAAGPVAAEISPQPGRVDPHIQTAPYDADQVVLLRIALNYALTIEFSPDERIENVSVGNSGAWQVTANKSANRLFVKPMQMSVDTDMTVITDTRAYTFALRAAPALDGSMAYVLRFLYPKAPQEPVPATPATDTVVYRFDGARELRPVSMSDDGRSTTIAWPAKSPIPVVSIVGDDGRESLANGVVRDNRFVVDEVANRFTFRIEGRTAGATRRVEKARRP
jgi:type IV secretion system protein VirB9